MFSQCLSVHRWGVSPSRLGSLSRGFLSRGSLCLGVLCPGGLCTCVQGGLCQGGVCPGGSLSRRVSVQGGLCPGGLCPEGISIQGGVCVQVVSVLDGISVQWGLCIGGSLSPRCLCVVGCLSGRPPAYRDPYGNERAAHILLECILVLVCGQWLEGNTLALTRHKDLLSRSLLKHVIFIERIFLNNWSRRFVESWNHGLLKLYCTNPWISSVYMRITCARPCNTLSSLS